MSRNQNQIDIEALEAHAIKTYLSYYITNLLTNAFFISLYFVQIYEDHPQCIYKQSGGIVTTEFDIAFIIGGIVHTAEFLNTNCICILFRYKAKNEKEFSFGSKSSRSYVKY